MARPRMIVVAGPPGSGKTRYFPVTAFGVDAFNIDDRCAQILGSYRAIPRAVRVAVANECERFVLDHVTHRKSFAVETTLRTLASIKQAHLACKNGFVSEMRFAATDSVAENVAVYCSAPKPAATLRPNVRSAQSTSRALGTCKPPSPLSIASVSTIRRLDGLHLDWSPLRVMAK